MVEHFNPQTKPKDNHPKDIKKIRDKRQCLNQNKQVPHTIPWNYHEKESNNEIKEIQTDYSKTFSYKQIFLTKKQQHKYLGVFQQSSTHAEADKSAKIGLSDKSKGWAQAYIDLKNLIIVKHYSKKTLRAYNTWIRKFQGFTRNKDINSLSSLDVKEFIEH